MSKQENATPVGIQAKLPIAGICRNTKSTIYQGRTPSVECLTALFALGSVKGFGPNKFKLIHEQGLSPESVLDNPESLPIKGKIGEKLRLQLRSFTNDRIDQCKKRSLRQLETADRLSAHILTFESQFYPKSVYASNNSLPVLYVRGNPGILNRQAVAVVGSRKIRAPYSERVRDFVDTACSLRQVISSGFAMGADTIGHQTAFKNRGATICVMPCGLNRLFPPENRELWETLLSYECAAFISEFAFGTGANSLNLRKRNKLIVALASGILISQSAHHGGAMNAYRFGVDLNRSIATFEDDRSEDTSGNRKIGHDAKSTVFVADQKNQSSYEKWIRSL